MAVNKFPNIFFYLYLLEFCLVQGQWNNGCHFFNKSPTKALSLPVQYVPAATSTYQDSPASCRQYDSFGPFPYVPYQNYPGEAEVKSLQSSYPGQPVIVINNGGNGDSGRGENDFDIEELLTLMFAFGGGGLLGRGRHHRHHGPEFEFPREEPERRNTPPYPYYGYPGFGMPRDFSEEMKPRDSSKASKINITIVLPNTSSSTNVQVENKTTEDKKNKAEIDEIGSEDK